MNKFETGLQSCPPDVTRRGCLYGDVQCIMGNGHVGTPPLDRQTPMKILPSRNFVGRWYKVRLQRSFACNKQFSFKSSPSFYRTPTKLRESNAFSCVCWVGFSFDHYLERFKLVHLGTQYHPPPQPPRHHPY